MTAVSSIARPWALVTGASAGIGAEFCRQLAARGYRLVMVARRGVNLASLAQELEESWSTESRIYPLDLSRSNAGAELDGWLESERIEIEFLVNNAGYGLPGHYTDADWSSHAKFLQVMVTTVCDLTWRLLPRMQSRKKGFVINVASLAGLVPGMAGHTLYGAAKAFLVRFSESLALENQSTGVKVSALCPGFTFSEFHDVTGTRELVNRLPAWMWMSATDVVAHGIRAVTHSPPRVVAVPGRVNRMIARLVRCLPSALTWALVRWFSGRVRKQHTSAD